jgi:hypothetical protein
MNRFTEFFSGSHQAHAVGRMATVALLLQLGVAGLYAEQSLVNMTFSGTAGPTPANLQANSSSGQDDFAGTGSLGSFTFRDLNAESNTPSTSDTCSGSNNLYILRTAGAGVFRFADGSLLTVTMKQGADCIDLMKQQAHCLVIFQITGGTGRFQNASGIITMNETVWPILPDATGNPVFFAANGHFTGTVSGVGRSDLPDGDRRD